jgi:hypothetical protein
VEAEKEADFIIDHMNSLDLFNVVEHALKEMRKLHFLYLNREGHIESTLRKKLISLLQI